MHVFGQLGYYILVLLMKQLFSESNIPKGYMWPNQALGWRFLGSKLEQTPQVLCEFLSCIYYLRALLTKDWIEHWWTFVIHSSLWPIKVRVLVFPIWPLKEYRFYNENDSRTKFCFRPFNSSYWILKILGLIFWDPRFSKFNNLSLKA